MFFTYMALRVNFLSVNVENRVQSQASFVEFAVDSVAQGKVIF